MQRGGYLREAGKREESVDVFANAYRVLEQGLKEKAYPGYVALVGRRGKVLAHWSSGYACLEPQEVTMGDETIFDLASLTKVVATITAILRLAAQGLLALDEPCATWFPELTASGYSLSGKGEITVRHLLTHTGGFPPWRAFYLDCHSPEETIAAICNLDLTYPPGSRVVYSDLGFMLLGELIQRVSGKPLDVFVQEEVFRPLLMTTACYNPPPKLRSQIAATEKGNQFEESMVGETKTRFSGWRRETIWGEVNDGNCFYAMKGVSGHAGVFATANDLGRLAGMYLSMGLSSGQRYLPAAAISEATANQTPHLDTRRGLGWSLRPTGLRKLTSCGDFLSDAAFGHTGFTGTSLWIDPKLDVYIILLTNRLHPKATSGFDAVRARFHNAVITDLTKLEA